MPEAATTRFGFIAPSGSDDIPLGDDQIRAILAIIEAKGAGFIPSTAYADRPAANAANAYKFHVASDNGIVGMSIGTGWIDINPKDLAVGTASLRTLGAGAQQAAPGNHNHAGVYDPAGTAAALAALIVQVPIGGQVGYAGSGDPADPAWLLADGRLIDKTTYGAFFAAVGHSYNGGVDPGSNKVRIPDKRGRVSVGADNMGTAQGAASRIPNSNRVRGQNGGTETHTLTTAQIPAHAHTVPGTTSGLAGAYPKMTDGPSNATVDTGSAGGGGSHPNMQPYEVDNVIVRVA